MPCYPVFSEDRSEVVGHICGDLGPQCSRCGDVAESLCDYPVGDGKTCDAQLCQHCAAEVAPDVHYCPGHAAAFDEFRVAGGVTAVLSGVVPFGKSKE
jgi:hypothetical protein